MRQRALLVLALLLFAVAAAPLASAQTPDAMAGAAVLPGDLGLNPAELIGAAGRVLSGEARDAADAGSAAGSDEGFSTALNILVLLTVIALAPSIMLMTTSFVRIVVVLGLLRQALGTQGLPPPQVTTGLALFMTLLVMAPTIDRVHDEAIAPYQAGELAGYDDLWQRAKSPVRDFMFDQIESTGNWSSLFMVLNYRGVDTSNPESLTRSDVDMLSLVPAYMLSELKTAFLIGFRIYLPFLIIDMVIASLLISMSMMMLPPVLISLPFKLLLFVLVDGWQLLAGSLMTSFAPAAPVGEAAVATEAARSMAHQLAAAASGFV